MCCIVVPDPQPPSRPLPPTPRDDPRQPHKVSTPPSNHQPLIGGGGSGGSGGQSASQRNSHVFKPMVSFYCFLFLFISVLQLLLSHLFYANKIYKMNHLSLELFMTIILIRNIFFSDIY